MKRKDFVMGAGRLKKEGSVDVSIHLKRIDLLSECTGSCFLSQKGTEKDEDLHEEAISV